MRHETIQEGGGRGSYRSRGAARGLGPRRYRRTLVEAAIEVEGPAKGGYPRRYRRAEVEAAIEVEGQPEGEARDDTGGRW